MYFIDSIGQRAKQGSQNQGYDQIQGNSRKIPTKHQEGEKEEDQVDEKPLHGCKRKGGRSLLKYIGIRIVSLMKYHWFIPSVGHYLLRSQILRFQTAQNRNQEANHSSRGLLLHSTH